MAEETKPVPGGGEDGEAGGPDRDNYFRDHVWPGMPRVKGIGPDDAANAELRRIAGAAGPDEYLARRHYRGEGPLRRWLILIALASIPFVLFVLFAVGYHVYQDHQQWHLIRQWVIQYSQSLQKQQPAK